MLLRAEDGVEEDAAEGDLGAALMGEGVIDDGPEADTRKQGQHPEHQQAADLIPVPDGLAEQAIGAGVVVLFRLPGGLPDPADGAAPQADDPGSDQLAEAGVDLPAEGARQGV